MLTKKFYCGLPNDRIKTVSAESKAQALGKLWRIGEYDIKFCLPENEFHHVVKFILNRLDKTAKDIESEKEENNDG